MILNETELSETTTTEKLIALPDTAEVRYNNAVTGMNRLFTERFPKVVSGYKADVQKLYVDNIAGLNTYNLMFDNEVAFKETLTKTPYEQYFEMRDTLAKTLVEINKAYNTIKSRDTNTRAVVDKVIRANVPASAMANIDTIYTFIDGKLHALNYKDKNTNITMFGGFSSNTYYYTNLLQRDILGAINDYFIKLRDAQEQELRQFADSLPKVKSLYNSLVDARKNIYAYINSRYYIIKDSFGGVKLVDKSAQATAVMEKAKAETNTKAGLIGVALGVTALLLNS